MQRLWRGETVDGVNLSPPEAAKGGPPILIGSWAGSSWIPKAARDYDGWIASAMYTGAPTLKAGVERFRELGGKRAVITNILVDLKAPTEPLSRPSDRRPLMPVSRVHKASALYSRRSAGMLGPILKPPAL